MKATEKTNAKSELNAVLKEEYNSYTMLCKVLTLKKSTQAMKDYLNLYNLKFENLVDLDYIRPALNFSTFTAKDGHTFETISRKTKSGEIVIAKWSFWLILSAAAKVRKQEILAAQKAAKIATMKAKEQSLKQIEKEEKKKAA